MPHNQSHPALRIIWLAWIGGTILIVLSWCHVVSPDIGWIGFGVAGVAALISYIPDVSSRGTQQAIDHGALVLTDEMLASQDPEYRSVIERFRQGATLADRHVAAKDYAAVEKFDEALRLCSLSWFLSEGA